jgi:hypothetical protein
MRFLRPEFGMGGADFIEIASFNSPQNKIPASTKEVKDCGKNSNNHTKKFITRQ